jgi:hypothetical protein
MEVTPGRKGSSNTEERQQRDNRETTEKQQTDNRRYRGNHSALARTRLG